MNGSQSRGYNHLPILGLDRRWKNVFGRADVDAAAQFAVSDAVEEIDHHPNREPHKEPNPSQDWQAQHQCETKKYAEYRKDRNEGDAEWARARRFRSPQNDDADADQNKSEECSDVG